MLLRTVRMTFAPDRVADFLALFADAPVAHSQTRAGKEDM